MEDADILMIFYPQVGYGVYSACVCSDTDLNPRWGSTALFINFGAVVVMLNTGVPWKNGYRFN